MKQFVKQYLLLALCFSIVTVSCAQKRKTTKKKKVTTNTVSKPVAKTDTIAKAEVFKIKIVRTSCASLVAIILDEPFQKLGEEWAPHNVRMIHPFKAAVNIANKCALPNNVKEGHIVKVSLISDKEAEKTPCVVCMMMDYPPSSRINVKFIEDLGEEK